MTNTVTLSSETLNALKKMYEIDMSIRIAADSVETKTDEDGNEKSVTVLRSKSNNKTMLARVEIPEVFPRDTNIYDLREFIAAVGIVTEPELDFSNDNYILIKSSDDKQVLRYLESTPELIHSYMNRDLDIGDVDIELEVTQDEFKQVITAANTMKLSNVGFISDGETIELSAFDKNSGDGRDTKKFSLDIGEGTEGVTFRMFYVLSTHNLFVLQGEGKLSIKINAKKKISRIDTESGKTFWIATDAKSEYSSDD